MDNYKKKRSDFLIEYISLFIKWRKYIILNSFVICCIIAVISLCMPKWFASSVTILPPSSESSGLGISSLMQDVPFNLGAFGMGGMSEEASLVTAIFKSRTMMESVIREFDLIKVFKCVNMEEAVRALRSRVWIKVNDEGTITLGVKSKTKWFAGNEGNNDTRTFVQNIAKYFVSELDRLNKNFRNERAVNHRMFIEKRYLQNKNDLRVAESALQEFQKEYGVIALPEQTAAAIEAASKIQAQIMLKEVQVGVLESSLGKTHSDVIRAKSELSELRNKLNEMKNGSVDIDSSESNFSNVYIPFNDVPDIGVEYIRLFREVTLQEKLMEFLLPQYEQAKIEEARDTPTIQVLDPPSKPIKRVSPKRMMMVLTAGIISFLLSLVIIYALIKVESLKVKNPDIYNQIIILANSFKPRNWFK